MQGRALGDWRNLATGQQAYWHTRLFDRMLRRITNVTTTPECPLQTIARTLRLNPILSGLLLISALALSACGEGPRSGNDQIDPARLAFAMREAESLRSRGARVWCVPFARNLSGVEIRGNARTWWKQAQGRFEVGKTPEVGAVMAFSATRSMPLGHVAVVSEVVDDRTLRIDHANWHRNKVSLGMAVIDVSDKNDWSRVRVETNPGAFGSVYPINGFIHPNS